MERIMQMIPATRRQRRPSFATRLLILSVIMYSPNNTSASSRRSVPFTTTNDATFKPSSIARPQPSRNRDSVTRSRNWKLSNQEHGQIISNHANYRGDEEERNYDLDPVDLYPKKYKSKSLFSSNLPKRESLNKTGTNLLQISLSLALQHSSSSGTRAQMKTFLDTGAQVTIMTFEAAKRAGIAHLIDTRYSGHASGVAGVSCRVLGRIPARTVAFMIDGNDGEHEIDNTPSITVLEDKILGGGNHNGVDMLIGLDVLEEWKATLCLSERTLTVRNAKTSSRHSIVIPLSNKKNDTLSEDARSRYGKNNIKETQDDSASLSMNHSSYIDADYRSYNKQRYINKSIDTKIEEEVVLAVEEEDDDYSDNYFFIESEDDIDECDLSGV